MIYANVYADDRTNNSLFALNDDVHRFNPTYTPRLLRDAFLAHGIEINTPDLNVGRTISFDLYIEGRFFSEDKIPKFLLALENPYINTLNRDVDYCKKFIKVFSWDLAIYDLKNVIPIQFPHPLIINENVGFSERTIFSCLINANKSFKDNRDSDLYIERIKTIKWCESHAFDKFQLYGMGWEKTAPAFNFLGKLKRIIPRIKTKIFGLAPYPSYRGEVENKADILKMAKYCYCYENSRDLTNFITEKIFDCFVNGCVPIYWGSDNIDKVIPVNCFIDRRGFTDTAAVHQYLLTISPDQFESYQKNIKNFLESEDARKFSSQYMVSTIVKNIISNV